MKVKFSEDIIPLSDLKINPGKVVRHTSEANRPVLLTSRGRGVAIVQSINDYEKSDEERTFMKGVVKGLLDIEEGREMSLADVKKRLNLK